MYVKWLKKEGEAVVKSVKGGELEETKSFDAAISKSVI